MAQRQTAVKFVKCGLHSLKDGHSLDNCPCFFQIVYVIDMLLASFPRCPPGYGMACALTACSAAIRDVNFAHFAIRAEQQLCKMARQLEPALLTLTCYLPSISSSAATTRVPMADLVVFFDGLRTLVLNLLEEKRCWTAPRGSRKRCLHCYLNWLDFMAALVPIHSFNDWMTSTFMIVCVFGWLGNHSRHPAMGGGC